MPMPMPHNPCACPEPMPYAHAHALCPCPTMLLLSDQAASKDALEVQIDTATCVTSQLPHHAQQLSTMLARLLAIFGCSVSRYRALNSAAMRLIAAEGGMLMTCSCSGAVTQNDDFLPMLQVLPLTPPAQPFSTLLPAETRIPKNIPGCPTWDHWST